MTYIKSYTYGHLFHLDLPGYYQFVTFRTRDSIDYYIKKIFSYNIEESEKQQKIDNYSDTADKGAYLTGEVLQYLYDFLKGNDGKIYEIVSFAIMPNHVHLLINPLISISEAMRIIKGSSSRRINKILKKEGRFWAEDYYDKAVRDKKHFEVIYRYIRNNPLKLNNIGSAGLNLRYYSIYEKAG